MNSDKGKQILAYAMNSEHCVLEFSELDNGEMHVVDITDHVEALEEKVNG